MLVERLLVDRERLAGAALPGKLLAMPEPALSKRYKRRVVGKNSSDAPSDLLDVRRIDLQARLTNHLARRATA